MVRPCLLILPALFALSAAAKDETPPTPSTPTLEPTIKAQGTESKERVLFQTTEAVWKTNRRRVIPEPEAAADVPPQPLAVVTAVGLMDAMTGLVTIPWDIFSSPFRKPTAFLVKTWKISGRLIDKKGRPRAYAPLTVTVDRFDAQRDASAGQAASTETHADAAGAFSVALTGRIEKQYRAEISIYTEGRDGKRVLERRVFDE